MSNSRKQFGGRAQPVQFAVHDVGGVVGQHQPRIMFYQMEPAAAARLADKIGAARQQLRHRMVEAAHQGAVDEEMIGGHGVRLHRHSGAMQSIEPGMTEMIARRRMTETPYAAAFTSSLMTKNFTKSIRPKLVVSATSAASRPVPIRMRPMRGLLWRASKVCHWPDR